MELTKVDHRKIINRIKNRKKILRKTSRELKEHFVGIDGQIDKIITSISTWYCMPELLTRPPVVCLFGPTGVGKTDLVRRLVKSLGFQDRFCEIEMSNKGSQNHPWENSISSILSQNPKIESGKPSIVLLDEIQRFRTVDEEGRELHDYKFKDIWTLLSDGKLPFNVEVDYLLQLLWSYKKKEEKDKKIVKSPSPPPPEHPKPEDVVITTSQLVPSIDEDDDEGEGIEFDSEKAGYHQLKHFKNVLRLEEPLEEIAKWDDSKKRIVLMDKLNDPTLYNEEDYSKALIFISGNLDEAYTFAKESADEVDVDPDIFYEISLKINILDIKRALSKRFKAEQIARFGNVHVIYPSLSKKTYQIIITKKIDEIKKRVLDQFNKKIDVDQSINDLIYSNGVFSTQGTRPVFSTISEVIETSLPVFLLQSFIRNEDNFKIFYEKNKIIAKFKDFNLSIPYRGSLDEIKKGRGRDINRRVLSSVHEAGHALVYTLLFKTCPPQLMSSPMSRYHDGFVYLHENCGSKELIENRVCVLVAGLEAEKLIFGESNRTSGSSSDLRDASSEIGNMIRRFGMSEYQTVFCCEEKCDNLNTDFDSTNVIMETIMRDLMTRTRNLIKDNIKVLMTIVDELMIKDSMTPQEFKKICDKNSIPARIKKSEDVIYSNYFDQYKIFVDKNNK